MGEISKISKHKESSMRKTEKNLSILTALFVVSLIISNVITGKIINTGIPSDLKAIREIKRLKAFGQWLL